MELIVKNDAIAIQQSSTHSSFFQRDIFILALIFSGLTSIAIFVFAKIRPLRQVPLSGDTSIASLVILFGAITGAILFCVFFIRNRKHAGEPYSGNVFWRNFPIVVISYIVILALALLGIFWLLGTMFHGASFDAFTSAIICLIFSFFINYFMSLAALAVSARTLTNLFISVFVSGVAISMATNGQDHWWQHNLSYLGTHLATDSWQFNSTLILSAFVMLALVDYLFVSLKQRYPKSWQLTLLRLLLMLTAIDLGAVGLFPNNTTFHWFHDQIAMLLVYLIIALIISIRWLLPGVSFEFLMLSYVLGGGLILLDIAYQGIHYLSLTAFELSAFIVAFSWIMLLLQRIKDLVGENGQRFSVVISK